MKSVMPKQLGLMTLCLLFAVGCRKSYSQNDDLAKINIGGDSMFSLRIKFWVSSGVSGGLKQAIQFTYNCSFEKDGYPFNEHAAHGEIRYIALSKQAATSVRKFIIGKNFWTTKLEADPHLVDYLNESLCITINSESHQINEQVKTNDGTSYIDTILSKINELSNANPVENTDR